MSLIGTKVVKNTVPPRMVGLLRSRSPATGNVTNQPCLFATTPEIEVFEVPLTVAAEVIGPTFVVPEHGVGEQAKLASSTVGTRLEPLKMPQLPKVSG